MAVSLPNGVVFNVASAYAAAKTITAITNANPAVATCAAHGLTDGDIIVLSSGWNKLSEKAVRIANSDTNTFELEGVDTTNTTTFPAGGGVGTFREVTSWVQISQVLENTSQGGDQQFVTYSFLEEDVEHQIPTVKSASSIQFSIGDDALLAWYPILSTANDDRQPRAVKAVLPAGSLILYNGYITLNKTPSMTKNQIMALASTLSLTSEPVRYTA